MTMTVQAGTVEVPAGRPEPATGSPLAEDAPPVGALVAPTARLVLPAGDLDDPAYREQWHEARRGGIGGSDIGAILGLDKYRGPRHVFEAKHGREDSGDSEAAWIGREIEGFIARLFSAKSGMAIADPPGTLAHVDHPWARVNVDRYALWDQAAQAVAGPVECKNRSEYQLDDWEDGVPYAAALQCHWAMAVGGWDVGYVAALVGGNKLRWHLIPRDEEMVGYLLDYCGRWYQQHVVEGLPPEPDGLETTKALLARLWEVAPEEVAQVDLDKARELRARRADLDAQIKALTREKTQVENCMRDLAGSAAVVKAGAGIAWTWKPNGNFSADDFRERYPQAAAQCTHTAEVLDLDAIKEKFPDEYAACRGRRLLIPKKEL